MCPVCWAAALTYFTGIAATSLVAVAGKDLWVLSIGIPTALLSALRNWHYVDVPWWALLLLTIVLLVRISVLVFRSRARLLTTIWQHARRLAKRSCPNRQLP